MSPALTKKRIWCDDRKKRQKKKKPCGSTDPRMRESYALFARARRSTCSNTAVPNELYELVMETLDAITTNQERHWNIESTT